MSNPDKKAIPFVDLKANYLTIKEEIDIAIQSVIAETSFIKGPSVKIFEEGFAEYIGTKFCIGCGNGTDALELILRALEIGPGDEVIVPALTWIATAEAVNNVGAEPVFADIQLSDYTLDPVSVGRSITKRTKAIIPVHLYGCPCDMDELINIATQSKLLVIEDCAQSHGAEYSGQKTGTFGIASSFSFFPSKNLGAFGDAGAVVTNDPDLADRIRMLANHGQLHTRHKHYSIGRNSRLDSIQAAILNVKLRHLDDWNNLRIEASKLYDSYLSHYDKVILTDLSPRKKHVNHLYVVRIGERNRTLEFLNNEGINSSVHYPTPLPFLEAYKYKKHIPDDFPNSLIATETIISLPIFPEIKKEQIERVCSSFIKYLKAI